MSQMNSRSGIEGIESTLTLNLMSPRGSVDIDDSDDEDTFRDNLQVDELQRNVYMRKDSSIKSLIKDSTNAQQDFI